MTNAEIDAASVKPGAVPVGTGELVGVLELCTLKSRTDDALGRFSDHEGGDIGPTWSLWSNLSVEDYEAHVEYEISLHKENIRTMRRLLRLKRKHPNSRS